MDRQEASAFIPSIRAEPESRTELESVLQPYETRTEFIDATVRNAIAFRRVQTTFHARAQAAIGAIKAAAQRQWVIPFGGTRYAALQAIVSTSEVMMLAPRAQREEDCH